VSKQLTIAELENKRRELLDKLHLLHRPGAQEAKSILAQVEPAFLEKIKAMCPIAPQDRGFSRSAYQFVERSFMQTTEGKQFFLEKEITLLKQISETKTEASLSLFDGASLHLFPVCVGDTVVHCLFTGMLITELGKASCSSTISKICNIPQEAIEAQVELLNGMNEEDTIRLVKQHRDQAEAISQSLIHHIRVNELSSQVIQAERTRSLGTLSSGISNHFNNLLSIILGYSSHILNVEENISPENTEALKHITEAAQRGRRLTEELLSFTGSETEEESINKVHDSINNVLALLQTECHHRCDIQAVLEAKTDSVLALSSDLHQIIFNFLTLIFDTASEKSKVIVRSTNVELDGETYIQITATDPDGTLKTEDLEEFSDGQHEMRFLSLQGTIDRIQGSMNSPGNETIEISLPVTDVVPTLWPEKIVKPRSIASNIWVVDDDPLFRQMCTQVLSEEGHTIIEFEGGKELQEALTKTQEKPDLIVSDYSMPEMTGMELREWLVEEKYKTPLVLVSGLSPNQPDIKKAITMKKTYFLQKPFTYRELSDLTSVAMGETLLGE